MVELTIADDTTVTINEGTNSLDVTGPGKFYAESCTIAGTQYKGTVIVNASGFLNPYSYTPAQIESLPAVMALTACLALVCTRFRIF